MHYYMNYGRWKWGFAWDLWHKSSDCLFVGYRLKPKLARWGNEDFRRMYRYFGVVVRFSRIKMSRLGRKEWFLPNIRGNDAGKASQTETSARGQTGVEKSDVNATVVRPQGRQQSCLPFFSVAMFPSWAGVKTTCSVPILFEIFKSMGRLGNLFWCGEF
jgi:hypothetical protein